MSSIKLRALLVLGVLLLASTFSFGVTPPDKEIIVLTAASNGTTLTVTGVMWFTINTGMRPQTAGSLWVASGTSAGATTAENTAIQNGTVYEESFTVSFPISTATSAIQAYLQQQWTDRNAQINGNGANLYYGVFFNGTSWSQS